MNNGTLLRDANLIELSPLHVDETGRTGFYHEDKAVALGRLMAVDGQRDPIKVRANPGNAEKPWKLVTGMHRLMGARIEGMTIFAIEVTGKPEDMKDLESSENLHRRPLGLIERAKFTAALVTAAQERLARQHGNLSQQQLAIKARWDRVKHLEEGAEEALQEETNDTADTMSAVYGWQESVADALGMDKRTIRRDLSIFRLVVEPFPDLAEELAKHPVVGDNQKQLLDLTRLKSEAVRRRVIEALLANTEIGVEDAKIAAGADEFAAKVEPVAHMKFVFAVESNWKRLTIPQQHEQLPRISAAATGTLTFTGSATTTVRIGAAAAGAISLGGSAAATVRTDASAVGSLSLSGAGGAGVAISAGALGGLDLSGAGAAALAIDAAAAGAITLGGAAEALGSSPVASPAPSRSFRWSRDAGSYRWPAERRSAFAWRRGTSRFTWTAKDAA